jgi:hypothetical protein
LANKKNIYNFEALLFNMMNRALSVREGLVIRIDKAPEL